ncbi:MAG: hypothetical protein J7M18_03945, partial [Candidatus Eremiobacteraeota bacterium]|nr:hypothetical protein [Candidatus Eremiobacteraeota bacterium]
ADKNKVTIGERIKYTLILEYDPEIDFTPPRAEEFKFDPFSTKDYVATPMPDKEGRKVVRYIFQLAIYDLGKYEIPPVTVSYKGKDGKTAYAKSEKIPVEVIPVPVRPGDKPDMVRPAKPPIEVEFPEWYYLIPALIILILAALAWFIITLIRRKKKVEEERILPPHEKALSAISKLEKENLPAKKRWKDYYTRLSAILREYIDERFDLPAPESTTWELIRMMRKKSIKPEVFELTGEVLSLADLVKFAKHIPAMDNCTEDMDRTRKIIENTIPGEPEDKNGAGTGSGGHERKKAGGLK